MKRLLAIATGALIFAVGIQAAKADPANPPESSSAASSAAAFPPDVLPTAKWWLHIDFDTARETNFGKHLHEKAMKEPHVKAFLEKIQDKWGLDLHKDLHAATLYSPSYIPHTGVLIAYAEASDGEKFMAELHKKPDFLELKTADGKYTLYTWTEAGPHWPMPPMKKPAAGAAHAPKPEAKPEEHDMHAHLMHELHEFMLHPHPRSAWACFPKHGVAIFADSATNLVAALNHTENQSESATPAADGTVFSGELCDIDTLPLPPQMRLAKKIASIRFNGGEKDGNDFDHVEVNLTDAAVAGQLKAIIAGLQAMGQVHFADHADLLKMIDALKVEASGQTVTIDWQASSDDVIHFADKVCDFIHKHHEERHK